MLPEKGDNIQKVKQTFILKSLAESLDLIKISIPQKKICHQILKMLFKQDGRFEAEYYLKDHLRRIYGLINNAAGLDTEGKEPLVFPKVVQKNQDDVQKTGNSSKNSTDDNNTLHSGPILTWRGRGKVVGYFFQHFWLIFFF